MSDKVTVQQLIATVESLALHLGSVSGFVPGDDLRENTRKVADAAIGIAADARMRGVVLSSSGVTVRVL